MNRQAQAVIMLLFGGALLRASLTDQFLRYVKEGLRAPLIVAGALLVATAIMTLWHDLRPRAASDHDHEDHGHEDHDHEDHEHGHGKVGWLLLLPVLGLLLVAPPALGSYSAGQAGSVLSAQSQESDYPPLQPGDPAPLTLVGYASRAVFDGGKSLDGRTVRLTGFITPGPGGEPMLARIVLTCCAADGRPIKVGLTGNTPAGIAEDTWVQVDGVYTDRTSKDPINDATVPYLEVKAWQRVAAPAEQYE